MNEQTILLFNKHKQSIQSTLSRTLVRLSFLHAVKHAEKPDSVQGWEAQLELGTGFLVDTGYEWYVCTAGHWIKDLKNAIMASRKLVTMDVDFGFHDDQHRRVRLDISRTKLNYCFDEKTGLDFGLVTLRISDRITLVAGGAEATSKEAALPLGLVPDMYVALGFPRSTRTMRVKSNDDQLNVELRQYCPMLPIEPIHDPYRLEQRPQLFRGRVVSRIGQCGAEIVPFTEANGMSGGPIFALKLDADRFQFALVAVVAFEQVEREVVGGCFYRHVSAKMKDVGAWFPAWTREQ